MRMLRNYKHNSGTKRKRETDHGCRSPSFNFKQAKPNRPKVQVTVKSSCREAIEAAVAATMDAHIKVSGLAGETVKETDNY